MGNIDLNSGFQALWAAVPNAGAVGTILTMIAVLVLIMSIGPWIWQKRKGGMTGFQGFPWMALVIAGILAGPTVVIPLLLTILSFIVNVLVGIGTYLLTLLS